MVTRKLDLFGRELLAVDGTRLKAVNSTDRNFTREKLVKMIRSADERLADYLSRLDRTDAEEDGASGRPAKNLTEKIAALKERKTRHEEMLKELERSGESQVSLTPDSRAMAAHPKVGVGYNAQVAFDAKHKAVLERMEARRAARPEILKQRREIAEHPFGSIKQWMNQSTFLLRGLEKVRAEFSLTALAYNFIRVVNIVGVASLVKAV